MTKLVGWPEPASFGCVNEVTKYCYAKKRCHGDLTQTGNLTLLKIPAQYQCCQRVIWNYHSFSKGLDDFFQWNTWERYTLTYSICCEGYFDLIVEMPCEGHKGILHACLQLLVFSGYSLCLRCLQTCWWRDGWMDRHRTTTDDISSAEDLIFIV